MTETPRIDWWECSRCGEDFDPADGSIVSFKKAQAELDGDYDPMPVPDAVCQNCMSDVERARVVELSELAVEQCDARIAFLERWLDDHPEPVG